MKWISCMYTYIPSLLSLPLPLSYPLGHHGTLSWAPCAVQQLPLASYFTHGTVYMSTACKYFIYASVYMSLNLSSPHLPLLCPQFCSVSLCLYSCPANRLFGTIFLDSICTQYMFFFFWLTSLCMTDSRSIYITTNDPNSYLLIAEYYVMVYMYHTFFIHSSVHRHLGCFHVLAVANSAA